MLTLPPELLIPLIIFLGALIYATFGFGDALFAMPLLTFVIGIKTATPLMTLNGVTMAAIMFVKHYRDIDWKSARRLVLASLLGIPFGIYFLKHGNEQITRAVLGMIIVGVSLYNLLSAKKNRHIHQRWAYLFGFVAGVLGGAFNTGGPSIVIFGTLSGWTQMQFVSTLQGYFLPSDCFIIIGHLASGLLTKTVLYYYLLSIPSLILALMLGGKIRRRIPPGKFNTYIFVLLLAVGVFFLLRVLWS